MQTKVTIEYLHAYLKGSGAKFAKDRLSDVKSQIANYNRRFRPRSKVWNVVPWPFDSDAARTIECHTIPIPYGKLYVWRDSTNDLKYSFTVSCGPNSDRSITGYTCTSDLNEAKLIAETYERENR